MTLAEEQKNKAIAVKDMIETTGWEIVAKELTEEGDKLNQELIKSNDPAEDTRLKAEIRAISKLINKIAFYNSIKT